MSRSRGTDAVGSSDASRDSDSARARSRSAVACWQMRTARGLATSCCVAAYDSFRGGGIVIPTVNGGRSWTYNKNSNVDALSTTLDTVSAQPPSSALRLEATSGALHAQGAISRSLEALPPLRARTAGLSIKLGLESQLSTQPWR